MPHNIIAKGNLFSRRVALGLLVLLLPLTPGCLPGQKVVAIPGQPFMAATRITLPAASSPPLVTVTTPTVVTPNAIAKQEDDDAVVDALAGLAAPAQAGAVRSSALTDDDEPEDLADLDKNKFSQKLIGPLLDPLFEPPVDDEKLAPPEELAADDQDDPQFTGELEPLSVEEIALPGPNDFGTLDGELVDTSDIGDLAAFSDPDTKYDLPVVINEQVKFFIDQYQTSHRKIFERWLARSGRFLPLIQAELAKAGLPQDLCYLPMIESGYRVNAYSPAKAVGAWQFIQSTGKMYDLTITKDIDERCDPVKSTRAAIRFLSDLHDDFQSWPLAIAAYNAGGGRIRTAVEKTGSTDFWELAKSRYLVSETKYYVPKLLAAIIVAKNPDRYGFEGVDYEPPLTFETVRVPQATHLAAVALAAGTDLEDIYSLNRHLRRAVTPANRDFCELCVPVGTSELISRNLPLVRTTFTTKFKTHVVKRKDTTARLSKIYGINSKTLLKINHLRIAKLKPGMRLQIPYQVKSFQLLNKIDRRVAVANPTPQVTTPGGEKAEKNSREPIRHKVRAGESIYQLSRRYNVSIEKIASWNNLSDPRRLSVGQTLDIYPDNRTAGSTTSPAKTATEAHPSEAAGTECRLAEATPPLFYEVRNGDTLFYIARKFQTTPEKIREWNSLGGNTIYPGLRLRLETGDDTNV
ncbi:MAG: LysM peptidoglycan-binding domain-containing protein [Desulfobulbaceae bacterium]|nr:LysM peptidoglycan-binding domain-containing protein [Desulfobulbaceae bacterium]